MKRIMTMVWLASMVAVNLQARQPSTQDINLRSDGMTYFGQAKAKIVKFGGYNTPECKLAIGVNDGLFYLTKMHSTCWNGINRNGVKIICNSNKSVCKKRSELTAFVRGGRYSSSTPDNQDIELRSGGTTYFGQAKAKIVKFGGYSTPECKLAIGVNNGLFYLRKMHSTCWKGNNRNGVKIICNSNKSVCKTRSELTAFVGRGGRQSGSATNNQDINLRSDGMTYFGQTKAKKGVMERQVTAFPSDKSIYAKSIPEKYLVKTKSGCALVNPIALGNESITWTGKCKDGLLDGYGKLQWYKNGIKNGSLKTRTIHNGLLGISKNNFSPKMPIIKKSNTAGKCYFMLPSVYVLSNSSVKNYFNVEFIGGCKNNQHNSVNIYFNNKLYAVYKGNIYRKSLPVNGRLEMFNGNIYKVGAHNGDRYATAKTYQDWIDGLHLIRKKGPSDLNVNDFMIKIGFNSTPSPVTVNNMSILGFSIGSSTSTKNSVDLKYDIQPKNALALTRNRYLMKLEVKIPYKETTSMGFLGISKNKVIYDYVTIELDKDKGYQSSGAKILKNVNTYRSGLGVKTVKSDFTPTVRVVSIEGK